MSAKHPRETPQARYESPTMTVVGGVSELTAGPIVKSAETSGGFKGGRGQAQKPRTDETTE
jgi:hypothetical protein